MPDIGHDLCKGGRTDVEKGPRITDWAEREPDVFIGRRATDGGAPGADVPSDRRRGERRRGERRAGDDGGAWMTMGLPERRAAVS